MTKENYDNRIAALEAELTAKKRVLAHEYAFANKEYSKGDIISNNTETLLVDEIKWSFVWCYSECVYYGARLKKNLEPFKNGDRGSMC